MPSRRNSYYMLLLHEVRRGYKDCMRMVNGQDLLQVIRHDLLHSDCAICLETCLYGVQRLRRVLMI